MIYFMNGLTEDLEWFFLGLRDLIAPERLWAAAAGNEPEIRLLTAECPAGVICAVDWDRCYG